MDEGKEERGGEEGERISLEGKSRETSYQPIPLRISSSLSLACSHFELPLSLPPPTKKQIKSQFSKSISFQWVLTFTLEDPFTPAKKNTKNIKNTKEI